MRKHDKKTVSVRLKKGQKDKILTKGNNFNKFVVQAIDEKLNNSYDLMDLFETGMQLTEVKVDVTNLIKETFTTESMVLDTSHLILKYNNNGIDYKLTFICTFTGLNEKKRHYLSYVGSEFHISALHDYYDKVVIEFNEREIMELIELELIIF